MTIAAHSVELQPLTGGNIVAFRLSGTLTKEDYAAFIPVLEDRIRHFGRIRILVELDDFHGWTAGAVWEDLKFDYRHFHDVERVAIIGESHWEKTIETFSRPFTAAQVKYFNIANREQALDWIQAH